MYEILMRLMFVASLAELGMTLSDLRDCHSRACLAQIERRARDVLHVDWKPISVFPEEARRFRSSDRRAQ